MILNTWEFVLFQREVWFIDLREWALCTKSRRLQLVVTLMKFQSLKYPEDDLSQHILTLGGIFFIQRFISLAMNGKDVFLVTLVEIHGGT